MVTSSPLPRLGFDMALNEMQWAIKWWLGLPLTSKGGVCAYCPDKALDAQVLAKEALKKKKGLHCLPMTLEC